MGARPGRSAIGVVLAVIAALVLGWVISGMVSSALAITYEEKDVPPETPSEYVDVEVGPLAPLGAVTVSDGPVPDDDPLLSTAARFVEEAAGARDTDAAGEPVAVDVVVEPDPGAHPEGYEITDDGPGLRIVAADRRGAGQGLFRLADRIRSGHDWGDAVTDGVVTPALDHRFVDLGAVGVEPDVEAYLAQDDYQHSSGALEEVVLESEPFLDEEGLAVADAEWREYIDHVASYGYNGVVIPGFLEYVNFDLLGDGYDVYGPDSPYRARHEAMRERVGEMWRYAHEMGLEVVFYSDMVALTGPLEEYLDRETGLDPADPYTWEVYRAGVDELLGEFDWADGLMIRIGEAGSIYNHEGWDYYSELEVTEAEDVRTMLRELSDAAAGHDANLYFRTWSVGVGDVGDMHTNTDTYDRLMGELDIGNLIVSTKFVMGDFDSYLPLNPTLTTGSEQRMVELQGRREFEVFSAIPNDVGPLHQTALRQFAADNASNVDGGEVTGVWMWTQDGGPWRASPMSLYLKEGLWELYDHTIYTGGRLAWDPDADLSAATGDWIRHRFTADPEAVRAVSEVFALSREAILDGLYIRPYAEQQVFALGLEPPPMMWVFKWDIVSGDTAALSAVYDSTAGRVDEAIAAGERAIGVAVRMRDVFSDVPAEAFHDPETHTLFAESLDYEVSLLRTLQTVRSAFLSYYEWLDTGSSEAKERFEAASAEYHDAVAAHEDRWSGNLNFPPYNFFASDTGMQYAERNGAMRVAAWVLLAVALAGLALVRPLRHGAFLPWRVRETIAAPGLSDRLLVVAVPLLAAVAGRIVFTSGLSLWFPVVSLGSLALLAVSARGVLAWHRPGADGFWLWAVLGGAVLLRTVILAAALSVRGPGAYWLRFWTHEENRELYVTVSFAAFCYVFIALVAVLTCAYGLRLRQGIGAVVAGVAGPAIAIGALLWVVGLERALTTLNDELALLPMGLSRILGLTVHLGIPGSLPLVLVWGGIALAVVGAALAWGPFRPRGTPT